MRDEGKTERNVFKTWDEMPQLHRLKGGGEIRAKEKTIKDAQIGGGARRWGKKWGCRKGPAESYGLISLTVQDFNPDTIH